MSVELQEQAPQQPTQPCLLTIYAPPSLEESLVDWLLENEVVKGFSTANAYGHGERQEPLTVFEQVTGRQRRTQFLVQTDTAIAGDLLRQLQEKFAGVGLYYILTPVLAAGRL